MSDRHAWAAALVAARPGERLLEIGCGTGEAAQLVLRDLGAHGALLAIDRSASAIARATERNRGMSNFEGRVTELTELDAQDDTFDAAWALNVNVFWTSNPSRELSMLARTLRPSGRLLLLWDAGPTGVDKLRPVAAHLDAAGFADIDQRADANGVVICARAN